MKLFSLNGNGSVARLGIKRASYRASHGFGSSGNTSLKTGMILL